MALVNHLFGDDPNSKPAHENVASAVFTTPQIGNVGLTEEEAAEKYPNLNIYKSVFRCGRDPLLAPAAGGVSTHQLAACVDPPILNTPWVSSPLGM